MKHKPKPKGSVLAALDIGSSKIACFIARIIDDEGGFEVLGIGHQASNGIKGGTVIDLEAAEASIRQAVNAAEHMAAQTIKGYPLREVVINVPGIHAQSHSFGVDIDVLGHEVTDHDIRRALARAQTQALSTDHELVHTIATGFTVDGHGGVRDPRGLFTQKMQAHIHLVTGDTGALRNIATCIERSHLDITAMCLSSYAAGLASLVEDEMDLGCTVIDMGGGVTSLAVFQGGSMIYADSIPVGGQHVTSDVARGLTTTMAAAERLKTLYGSAMASSTDESELIDVPQIGEDPDVAPNHVPRSLLVGIIQPRLEEIFELVRARLDDSGLGSAIGRRVVLTGGASQLPGLRDLGQHVLDKQVRLGRPLRVGALPEAVSGPAFATTAGLLTFISEHADEMPAAIMAQAEPGNLFDRVRLWLRENW
ncbi:cell division protein FtsA [Micavibrio aeruginosavorus]|uniref:Cell division protein FtsA n=1 Tax=Micavibrio aeruginosavorus (strain ARL-13) TaxID=856793 RepID=G2KMB0_MICAA|nr:cell division protein FtsA [Micavibrio aeruginosavorus]AEP10204.1 cell division protein FtsA [Micavibrio aeruginosavorus ARL-13]